MDPSAKATAARHSVNTVAIVQAKGFELVLSCMMDSCKLDSEIGKCPARKPNLRPSGCLERDWYYNLVGSLQVERLEGQRILFQGGSPR